MTLLVRFKLEKALLSMQCRGESILIFHPFVLLPVQEEEEEEEEASVSSAEGPAVVAGPGRKDCV